MNKARNVTACVLLALAMLMGSTAWAEPVHCPDVFRLDVFNAQGKLLRRASAFSLGDGKHLATNAHVFAGAARAHIVDPFGRSRTIGDVEYPGPETDLAIVTVTGRRSALPEYALHMTAPAAGQEIRVLAYTPDAGFVAVAGHIVELYRHPLFGRMLAITVPLIEGMSGAPVVDAACRLVGIAAFGIEGSEHVYFALPADVLTP